MGFFLLHSSKLIDFKGARTGVYMENEFYRKKYCCYYAQGSIKSELES